MSDPKKYLIRCLLALPFMLLPLIQTAAVTVPPTVRLAKDQVLVKNNAAEVASLDPHLCSGVPEANLLYDLIEGLVIGGPEGGIRPGVAESWETKDVQHWIFHLRRNAKWSNGDPITAHDFVYSWQRSVDPGTGSPYAGYLASAKVLNAQAITEGKKPKSSLGIRAIDDFTLSISLAEPLSYFLKMLTHYATSPVHRKSVELHGTKWTSVENWVGNGAYTLSTWIVNEKIVLSRNTHYWDNKNTVINQVTYLPIQSDNMQINRYRAGELDITSSNLPIEQFQKLKKTFKDELRLVPTLLVQHYEINVKKPPLNNVKVRKALTLALDRDAIVNKVKNQGDLVAYTFTPPATDGFAEFQPPWSKWTHAERVNEARKLLEEAGYNHKNPLKFTLLYNNSDNNKKLAIAAASLWKRDLGVHVILENQEWKTYLDSREAGRHQMARAGWSADYNEPSTFLNVFRSGPGCNNTSFYENPAYDKLLERSITSGTELERSELYKEAESLLSNEVPTIPVFHTVSHYLVKSYVGNFPVKNPLRQIYTKDLYILAH